MNEGWLWLSILKTTARPSPIDDHAGVLARALEHVPARVGSRLRYFLLDLYEQCSDHITEKIPSSG